MPDTCDKESQNQEVLADFLSSGDDVLTAYLELALKIYLRVKSEGQSIHTCGFDDEPTSSVPSFHEKVSQPSNSNPIS